MIPSCAAVCAFIHGGHELEKLGHIKGRTSPDGGQGYIICFYIFQKVEAVIFGIFKSRRIRHSLSSLSTLKYYKACSPSAM
jgi:hypothetical protein